VLPWRPRESHSGWEKSRHDKSFQGQAEEPLGTHSHSTIFKWSIECYLLIGRKKCFVLLCPIGKQHLVSSFREFVRDSFCLAILVWLVHQRNASNQETCSLINSSFQNSVYLKTETWEHYVRVFVKPLYQKYKLELTTSIQACINHAFVNIRKFQIPQRQHALKSCLKSKFAFFHSLS